MNVFIDEVKNGFVVKAHCEPDNSDHDDEVITLHFDGVQEYKFGADMIKSLFEKFLVVKPVTSVMSRKDVEEVIKGVMDAEG